MHNASTKTVVATFRSIYANEGLSALWVSYPTTLSGAAYVGMAKAHARTQ
jgi:hypothetical protein